MTQHTPEQQAILDALASFTPENFRRQRWILIDRARKANLEWNTIADALETQRPGAIRMYREFTPDDFRRVSAD
jgi:hypothetical protein